MDKRIGRNNTWPETTINGAQYTRPVSSIGLGNGYFAVLDSHGNSEESIQKLRDMVTSYVKPDNRKGASKDVQTKDS